APRARRPAPAPRRPGTREARGTAAPQATLAAWSPPPLDDLDVRCAPIPLQLLSEGGIVTGASLELPALCTSTV
ncbi:hypothetical protein, partial [Streptomyces decoyicus]|uniref:hypothetical protein n=1 Tax=Streptomyces decoyicus TaxID=249567 RepID=UPI0033A8C7D4